MIDPNCIAQAQKGDQRALSTLYTQLCSPLFRFVSYRVGRREDAEDIAQETMLAALKNISSYRGDAQFINWCYEIAKRKIADYWRAHYKIELTEWEEGLNITAPADINAPDTSHQDAIDVRVRTVLDSLPEHYARVLTLRFLQGYTLQETADELHISLSNAKVLQHRALKKASSLFHQPV